MPKKGITPASLKQSAEKLFPPLLKTQLFPLLKGIERKSKAGQNERDNGFYHMARILYMLQEQFPPQKESNQSEETTQNRPSFDCPLHILFSNPQIQEIAESLAAFHDLVDVKHSKRVFSKNQVDVNVYQTPESRAEYIVAQFRDTLKPLTVAPETFINLLKALDIVETTAEQIRDQYAVEHILPWQIPIAELTTIKEIVEKYGPLPLLIKAIELIDNLEYPLPAENSNTPNYRMRQDAIEAFYFYLPFLEIIGAYKLHRRLKELALRYLYPELCVTKSDGKPNWRSEIQSAIEKAHSLAERSKKAFQIIGPALLKTAEIAPNIQEQQIESLEQFAADMFWQVRDCNYPYSMQIIPPRIYHRIKGEGSTIEKAVRYSNKQSKEIEENEGTSVKNVANLILQIPDLYGVTMVISSEQLTKLKAKLENILKLLENLQSKYIHPSGTSLIEEINSEVGYVATHVILHIPKNITTNKEQWNQLVQILQLNVNEEQKLKQIVQQGDVRIEIHLTTPQNNLHNLFYATHIAYVASQKRKGQQAGDIQDLQEAENVIRQITYTWRP